MKEQIVKLLEQLEQKITNALTDITILEKEKAQLQQQLAEKELVIESLRAQNQVEQTEILSKVEELNVLIDNEEEVK